MMNRSHAQSLAAFSVLALLSAAAPAGIRISEWMYQGGNGEFVELVNLSNAPVSLVGWSFDDDSRLPGTFDLSALGTLAPYETAIITEADAAVFRAAWSMSASAKILGGNTTNLGRNDEINIFDGSSNLVDRLTFGDQTFSGTVRTNAKSGWNTPVGDAPWGNVTSAWLLSAVGDAQNSRTSAAGDIGSPGVFVPAPASIALTAIAGLVARRRR